MEATQGARGMNISIKPQHLKRYKDIALLFLKYGNRALVQQFGLRAVLRDDDYAAIGQGNPPEELANDLERMGPTYVKLGQLLSSRADLLPKPFLDALARLQDKVKPFSYEEVEATVSHELGVRLSKVFATFEQEPVAAASLGQVHRATLHDGRPVVVKVQRPNIRQQIAEDLEVLEDIANFLDDHTEFGHSYQVIQIFDEFQKTIIHELDYQFEASNLESVRESLREFESIKVPMPVRDFTTRAVLTMERIEGKKLTDIQPLERMELKGASLADDLLKAYLKQVLLDGLFHADPHPGNIFLTTDKRIALLDLGMVGRTSPEMQENLIKLLLAISEGHGDHVAELAIKMSETTSRFDETQFHRRTADLVAEYCNNSLKRIDVGRVLLELGRSAGQTGLYVPAELTLLGKTLLQLDQIGRALDPNFNPNEAVRRHVAEILNRRLKKEISSGKLLGVLLEMKEFIGGLPSRLNKILDAVGNSELEVKVRTTDVHIVLEGFQKIANRITTGLILAALIVGAALLMHVHTNFEIFGYPGFAMLCFMAAGGGGFWLVLNIVLADHKARKKRRRN
jgi:predicted unusual protein kinase regulating ubiquinone biosynthesis (AarF/ABC1/UbiB family)